MDGYETYRVTNWCRICVRQFLCNKETCTGLIRFSEIKDYGEVRRINQWQTTGKPEKN